MARRDNGDDSDATGVVIIIIVVVLLAIGVLTVGGSPPFIRELVTNETATTTPVSTDDSGG